MRRVRQLDPGNTDWRDDSYILLAHSQPVVIEPGSRQRAMCCVMCEEPVGADPCFLLAVIAGIVCPKDESHLNGAGMFCHTTCLPKRDEVLRRAIIRALVNAAH